MTSQIGPTPYADFPLFPHATRRWAKKIRGKLQYFGPWDDPDAALEKYPEQRDDLHAGRKPRSADDGVTVRELVNRFLTSKRHLLDTREITQRTFDDYHKTCERIGTAFAWNRLVDNIDARDFEKLRGEMGKRWGPVTVGNEVQRIRVVFKYAYDVGMIDKPMRFGPRAVKILKRHGSPAFLTLIFRNALFCVGKQVDPFEYLGIDLLSHCTEPLMRLRGQSNRLCTVALQHFGFQSHEFCVQPLDLTLLVAVSPIGELPLQPSDHDVLFTLPRRNSIEASRPSAHGTRSCRPPRRLRHRPR